MSEVTTRGNDDQAPSPSPGKKRDAHEGQTPDKPTRVSQVQQQRSCEGQENEKVGTHKTADETKDPKTLKIIEEEGMQHSKNYSRLTKKISKIHTENTLSNKTGQ